MEDTAVTATGQWFKPNGEPAEVVPQMRETPIFEQLVAESQQQPIEHEDPLTGMTE